MTTSDYGSYHKLLREQIRNEFTACQQYTAIAVWLDEEDLPQMARYFYDQALEERGHAMMMVQYLLDRDIKVPIPGVGDVRNEFVTVEDVVTFALENERAVTQQISHLASTARDEGDYLGEQFMQWFLKEQVEEVSSMSSLLKITKRAGEDLFKIEEYVEREMQPEGDDTTAPKQAGQR